MFKRIEYTKEAKARIAIAKKLMEVAQVACDREKEEWHVFTFKADKKDPDPMRFEIHKTTQTAIGLKIGKYLFAVTVFEKDKTVVLNNFHDDVYGLAGIDLSDQVELKDWKIETHK